MTESGTATPRTTQILCRKTTRINSNRQILSKIVDFNAQKGSEMSLGLTPSILQCVTPAGILYCKAEETE